MNFLLSLVSQDQIDSVIADHIKAEGYHPERGLKPVIDAQPQAIKEGESFPDKEISRFGKDNKIETVKSRSIIFGRTVAVFTIPGVFNGEESDALMKDLVAKAKDFKAAGVEKIYILSVDKQGMMGEWAKRLDPNGEIGLIADNWGKITHALGLAVACQVMGLLAKRSGLIFNKEAKLVYKTVEPKAGAVTVTKAETVLADYIKKTAATNNDKQLVKKT